MPDSNNERYFTVFGTYALTIRASSEEEAREIFEAGDFNYDDIEVLS